MAASNFRDRAITQSDLAVDSLTAARLLLGQRLVHIVEGRRLSGIIVETEAYCPDGSQDLACHGSKNSGSPTPRTALMFGDPGYAYVYFNYGIHWLFNVVTGQRGQPSAVLIRALEPEDGLDIMRRNRPGRRKIELTNGPAKLTQALQIDGSHNGENLCGAEGVIWIEAGAPQPAAAISAGPRVGLGQTPEPWLSKPWRFWLTGNPFVSKSK